VTVLTSAPETGGYNPQTGLTGAYVLFSFTSPGSSTYYCAKVTDSGSPSVTASSATSEFIVNPLPSVGAPVLSPKVLDSGQSPVSVTATVTWSGGTSPYTVTLYGGSSSSCASDTVAVVAASGITGKSTFLTFTSPSSSTYYCVKVTDNGIPPLTATSATSLFTVSAVLTNFFVLSPSVLDSGQSATVTATVTWSGGTPPFTVTLYGGSSPSCASDTTVVFSTGSNPHTGVTGTSTSFTFASAVSTYYCASVEDSSATPAIALSGTSQLTYNPPLSASLVSLSPPAIDLGQSTTVTATVSWSGGTSPYSVAVFSGTSPSCSLDTTSAGSKKTGLLVTSTTITFESPGLTTHYCAEVTDSSGVPFTFTTSSDVFTVNTVPTVSISPPAPLVVSGQSATLTALPSGGTPPYTYQWNEGSTCASTIPGQTSPTYATGVVTTTSAYSVKVTDSSTGTPSSVSSSCASVTLTVGYGPLGIASDSTTGMVYVADPGSDHITVIDSISNTVVTTIDVGSLPWGIAVNPATNLVYVTNYGSDTVTVINGSTNSVIATITVGTQPEGIAINPLLGIAYVANSGSNVVSVINTTSNAVVTSFPVGSIPVSVAVGPSPTYTVFVTNYGSNTVSAISVTVYGLPNAVTNTNVGSNPWGVVVDPSADSVYVTNSGSGTVTVLNGETYAKIATITVGNTPEDIVLDQANSMAYVTNAGSNTVSIINTVTNAAVKSSSPPVPIPVGPDPVDVALLPSTSLAYVTNSGTDTVSVINLVTNEVITYVTVS
jgi:YVTN family beta-propeller protein